MAYKNPYYDAYMAMQQPAFKQMQVDAINIQNNPFTNNYTQSALPTEPLTGGMVTQGDIVGDSVIRNPLSNSQKANIYSQAVMGGLQLASDIGGIAGQRLNLGTPAPQYFAQGVDPSYQGGEYYSRAALMQPQGASAGEILGTAGKAAATGASIGTMVGGPLGTLIGGGIGAVVGGIGAGIGGGVRKRRQRREREKALQMGESQQQEFNTAQDAFNQQQAAMASYQQRINPYRRLQNLYQ